MKNLVEQIKKARFVFICGNGGSAATAEHFTNDLFSSGIRAICLNSNTSIMTMIANDFGYDYVFSKQMEVLAGEEDLLIVISASGNSRNIVEALKFEKQKPLYTTFAIIGNAKGSKGGEAIKLADYYAYCDSKDYGEIEDTHLQLVHYIKNKL
jgi:D-sedoheptulose 7-phosphate isomerase